MLVIGHLSNMTASKVCSMGISTIISKLGVMLLVVIVNSGMSVELMPIV